MRVRSKVFLTGREKPYHKHRHSALGVRSESTSLEYECGECGYVGWSNHSDLRKMKDVK